MSSKTVAEGVGRSVGSVTATPDQALRRAAVRATLAPSVHNTQPWRFVLRPDALEIHADRSRHLAVLDPSGRQLIISCGCALFNARVALVSDGYEPLVERFPDPAKPDLLARIEIRPASSSGDIGDARIAALDDLIELRHSNRRRFADDPVPAALIDDTIAAAGREGTTLTEIQRPEDRLAVAIWSQRADAEQNASPAYRAELRAWTTEDPRRDDGVPAVAVPRSDGCAHDDIPVRDFDTHGAGKLPAETNSSLNQCLLLLGTESDTPMSWLRAGEGLERVLLEITRYGFVASPLTQVVEMPYCRHMLREDLRLAMYPHVLLRVGRAPQTPAPRRRRLVTMLAEAG